MTATSRWRRAVSVASRDDLTRAADGSVEVVLSPEEHGGDWLRLDDDASFLLMRQYFGDWERERPADLVIEPLDAPYPPPPTTPEEVAVDLDI
ncbi:MAG: hypothetical protein U5R31_03310 [Acidimicrobiia bacterium]|nr:hypothetical protein [Acidimicrobiia bacterium]